VGGESTARIAHVTTVDQSSCRISGFTGAGEIAVRLPSAGADGDSRYWIADFSVGTTDTCGHGTVCSTAESHVTHAGVAFSRQRSTSVLDRYDSAPDYGVHTANRFTGGLLALGGVAIITGLVPSV